MNKLNFQKFTNIKTTPLIQSIPGAAFEKTTCIHEMITGLDNVSYDISKEAGVNLQAGSGEPTPPEPPKNPQPGSTGVFLTPQSLVTFPVASATVTTLWKVLSLLPGLKNSIVLLLCIGFFVGLFIYYISLTPQMTKKEKLIGAVIAVINCVFLIASVMGINTVITPPTPGT